MPLIRYATGDFATLMSGARDPNKFCACGRGLPSFARVRSRLHADAAALAPNGG